MSMRFWVQDVKPAWLPEGYQVPPEMINSVQQLCKEAEIAYYQTDKDGNGFLKKKEFKKAMKYLGINKFEAKHMLKFVDRERLTVVSIKNYVNAYLFIKSGGLSFINTDYQGPITTGADNRTFMKPSETTSVLMYDPVELIHQRKNSLSFPHIAQSVFTGVPRPPPVGREIGFRATIKAYNGMYLCSENGILIANRTVAGPWEKFFYLSYEEWGSNYAILFAFRTYWNTYLCHDSSGTVMDNRTAIGPWEKFEAIGISPPNTFGWKTWTGEYLSVDGEGFLCASKTLGERESFVLKYVGAE